MQQKMPLALMLAVLGLIAVSCTTDVISIPKSELYTREFVKQFGVFDPNHDWNHSHRVNVTVTTSSPTDIRIYANVNGSRYLFGTFLGVNGSRELGVDIPKGVTEVVVNGGGQSVCAASGDRINLSATATGASRAVGVGDSKVKIKSLASEDFKDKWMVVPWLNGTIFRRKMPEDKYNADRDGVTPDFMFRNNNPTEVTFIIRPLFWQTNQTHQLGIFYYDEKGVMVHVPVWDMEKKSDYEDSDVYAIADSHVKYEIADVKAVKPYMDKYNVSDNLSAKDNFAQECSSADDRDMTLACRAYLEATLAPLEGRTDGKKFNYVYRWKFLDENDSDEVPDYKDKLLIVYTYFNYDNLHAAGTGDDPSGRWPTAPTGNTEPQLPANIIPSETPADDQWYNSIVSKGIEVTIPSGLLYGYYIENKNGGKRYYSTRSENFDPGYKPEPGSVRNENDDYSKFVQDGQASYAASWIGTKYAWRYLAFEDWPSNSGFESKMADLNDLVFIIDESEPYSTLIDIEHGDKISAPWEWVVAAEDLGTTDDFDFNDVVFGVSNYKEDADGKATVDVRALASGGTLPVYLCYTRGDGNKIRLNDGKEFHSWFDGDNLSSITINVGGKSAKGETVLVDVDKGFAMSCCQKVENPGEKGNMGGFSIEVVKDDKTVTEIHAPNLDGTAEYEAPQMICVPMDWCWPTERTHILTPYPKFQDWITSENSCPDWHDSSNRQSGYYNRTDIPALLPSAPTPDNPWGGSGEEGANGLSGVFVKAQSWGCDTYYYKIDKDILDSVTSIEIWLYCTGVSQNPDICTSENGDKKYATSSTFEFKDENLETLKEAGGFYVNYYINDKENFHVTVKMRINY